MQTMTVSDYFARTHNSLIRLIFSVALCLSSAVQGATNVIAQGVEDGAGMESTLSLLDSPLTDTWQQTAVLRRVSSIGRDMNGFRRLINPAENSFPARVITGHVYGNSLLYPPLDVADGDAIKPSSLVGMNHRDLFVMGVLWLSILGMLLLLYLLYRLRHPGSKLNDMGPGAENWYNSPFYD